MRYEGGELTLDNVTDAFEYHPWDDDQKTRGEIVRHNLAAAAEVILANVPRSPLRTRALNAIFDARMLANAAITFGKKE